MPTNRQQVLFREASKWCMRLCSIHLSSYYLTVVNHMSFVSQGCPWTSTVLLLDCKDIESHTTHTVHYCTIRLNIYSGCYYIASSSLINRVVRKPKLIPGWVHDTAIKLSFSSTVYYPSISSPITCHLLHRLEHDCVAISHLEQHIHSGHMVSFLQMRRTIEDGFDIYLVERDLRKL